MEQETDSKEEESPVAAEASSPGIEEKLTRAVQDFADFALEQQEEDPEDPEQEE